MWELRNQLLYGFTRCSRGRQSEILVNKEAADKIAAAATPKQVITDIMITFKSESKVLSLIVLSICTKNIPIVTMLNASRPLSAKSVLGRPSQNATIRMIAPINAIDK